jgi:hypothetical protein
MGGVGILYLAIVVLSIVGMWKVFAKAGKPGWAAIIPIYNMVVLLEIVNKPLWWIILMFIPFVNLVVGILVSIELAKCFGKDVGFAIGLVLLPFVFYPILGLGDARYAGAAAAVTPRMPTPGSNPPGSRL